MNLVNQLIIGSIGYATFFGAELILQMIKNTIWAQAAIVFHDFNELNGLLDEKSIDELELKSQLRNIFAKIADNNRYLNDFIDLYYWRFFLQSTLITFSVGLSVFLVIMESISSVNFI